MWRGAFGRRGLFVDSGSAGEDGRPGKQVWWCTCRYRGREGAPFRAGDLEKHILLPLENPADSDKGPKYKIKSSKSNHSYGMKLKSMAYRKHCSVCNYSALVETEGQFQYVCVRGEEH